MMSTKYNCCFLCLKLQAILLLSKKDLRERVQRLENSPSLSTTGYSRTMDGE